jgi:hypothetical protein
VDAIVYYPVMHQMLWLVVQVMGGFDELLHGATSSVEHVKRVGTTCPRYWK